MARKSRASVDHSTLGQVVGGDYGWSGRGNGARRAVIWRRSRYFFTQLDYSGNRGLERSWNSGTLELYTKCSGGLDCWGMEGIEDMKPID